VRPDHSSLSAASKLKPISRHAAVAACERGDAPLASVEGFVGQILGWRQLVRGLY
jgi:deoxyribodipyrimidine photolyase-related protein